MKTLKINIILFLIVFLSSCGTSRIVSKIIPIETTTITGQAVTVVQPAQTGSRTDIPTGWKPKDTLVIHQKGGAETYVNRETGEVAQNQQAQGITEKIEVPRKSWAWLYWTLGIMAILTAGNFLLKAYCGVNPFGWIFGKILKK